MKICWKKTLLYGIVGAVVIYLLLVWLMIGSFHPDRLKGPYIYQVPEESIDKGIYGYDRDKNYFLAQLDDAGITINIPQAGVISSVNVDAVPQTELRSKVQIYYTKGQEFSGDVYTENVLKNGVTKFLVNSECSKIRIDFTSAKGEAVEINGIDIIFADNDRREFLVFCPITILLYFVFIFLYVNRKNATARIMSNSSWGAKFDLVSQVCSLAHSDFRARFSGSYLGIVWGIIQPLSTILLFWFVFQVGFRSNPIDDVPFILWLSAGMIPWNYFYDAWFGGTSSFTAYGYIVKKVVFKVEMLPIVKALSSAIMNGIFNAILLVIYTLYGEFPGAHIVDMIYFSLCIFVLSLGLIFFTATLNVFMKDIGHFLGIILQFLMWMTPMMWDYHMIPDKLSWFYKLNPLHYVINGYRESLINGHWFFYRYQSMIYFWIVSLVLLAAGYILMKKLKPHFADVL